MYSYGGFFKFNFGYFPNRGGAATRPPRVEIMGYGVGIYRSVLQLYSTVSVIIDYLIIEVFISSINALKAHFSVARCEGHVTYLQRVGTAGT